MTPLQIQRQITQLRRLRTELSSLLYVHALADMEFEATNVYRQIVEIDSEIMSLRWMALDQIDARYLEAQGAAAVAAAERILGL